MTLADADIITLQGADWGNKSWRGILLKIEAVGGHRPALDVFVPVMNLVVIVELFWGPFSAKILSVYSVAGSRLVSAYSTVFPDTLRVISGSKQEIYTPWQLPVCCLGHQRTWPRAHTPSNIETFSDPTEKQVCFLR